jgi:hypothetical protein
MNGGEVMELKSPFLNFPRNEWRGENREKKAESSKRGAGNGSIFSMARLIQRRKVISE